MPRQSWVLSKEERSRCPGCKNPGTMLSHLRLPKGAPMFYICFGCHRVFQAGVGECKPANEREPT